MHRSQQPLLDILNQASHSGTDAVVLINKNGEQRTQSGHSSSTPHVQNMETIDSQASPVYDTTSSSSSSPIVGQTSKSVDVSQRREKFGVAGRSDRIKLDKISQNPHPELIGESQIISDKHALDPVSSSHGLNGTSINAEKTARHVSASDDIVINGTSTREHLKSNAIDSVSEPGESQSPSNETKAAGHDSDVKRHHPHYPFRQAHSEVIPSSAMQRRQSLVNVTEKGYARLQEELMRAQKALERKDEEVDELRGIRERLMKEVSDFTAALFEEVNSQLNEAALSEQLAKKQLKEADAKIEVLTAEVSALKDLVLTSTPSSPNKHLNPQIDTTSKKDKEGKPFWKTHRRSTSHHQFTKESRAMAEATEHHSLLKELDTVVFDEFARWLLQPTMAFTGQFFARVQQEDIHPCLNFKNTQLADKLLKSVRENTLSIEPIPGDQSFPRKCCLSESHKLCNYKIKFEGDDEWYSISQMSRNRIAAVCDFYAYLRYIVQGLVKCSDKDIFAELVKLRSKMAQARLGLI